MAEPRREQGRGGAVDSVVVWLETLQATEGIAGGQGVVRTQEVLSSHPPIGVDWVKAFWNGVPALNLVKSMEGRGIKRNTINRSLSCCWLCSRYLNSPWDYVNICFL